MNSIYNFCAGPAMLPKEVMKQAQNDLLDWNGQGCSVMEISHRSSAFINVAQQAEQDLRQLMSIPDNYAVLFCHGGGRGQFSAIPLNLARQNDIADYLVTGSWSHGAVSEAKKYLNVNAITAMTKVEGQQTLSDSGSWNLSDKPSYFHYCPNETVDGIEIPDPIHFSDIPVVADMSSNILSKTIDIENFAVIYAGAQKNIGPSGLSVVIIRQDLLERQRAHTPSIMNYSLLAKHQSMYNTPPTFAWYLAGLVFKWLLGKGGVSEIEKINLQKSSLLYQAIDGDDFYINRIRPTFRSRMNVPFQLANPSLDEKFLVDAKEAGLLALKGHRSVGGMRASIYNAMPLEGVQALVDFMQEFSKRNG